MNELIALVEDRAILDTKMVESLILVEKQIKKIKKVEKNNKKTIKEEMERKNVIKLVDEIGGLSITYVPAQNNLEKFHKELLQEERPEIYDEYVTMDGKRASYITVKFK